jgi:UDP-glucose 4-epimerase
MRVLVTGAAGFIGGYITAELLRAGHWVIGLDDFSKYGNADQPFGFEMVRGDAADEKTVAYLLGHFHCDHFVAAAALVGGIEYFHRRPYDILEVNNDIVRTACRAAHGCRGAGSRLRKVTFVSSSMVYESATSWPSREGDELRIPPPVSSYGMQKLCLEYYARALWEQYQVPYTIVRPFNCVGVGEDAKMSHVVPDLIRKVLAGQDPLRIYGDGTQVRHYTYGADLARGIVATLDNPAALNEDFNLASPQSTTVLELAEMIWRKLRPRELFSVTSDAPFTHDVQRRVPDTGKAEKVLGWTADTSLSDMVDVVIAEMTTSQS